MRGYSSLAKARFTHRKVIPALGGTFRAIVAQRPT
jgi:hypothetical protein